MRNIKLTIEYDGTAYHGWQSQVNAAAIQDVLNTAVNKLTGEVCTLYGSGRTDAGVHAYGQVANFRTASGIPADKFAYALNSILPEDIVILKSEEADPGFHARFSACGKKYRYLFYNSMFPSSLLRNRAWHVHYPLNVKAMREASGYFPGTHDFLAFSASGGSVKTTVRTISNIAIIGQGDTGRQGDGSPVYGGVISLEIEGSGFLYNMVRIIAGTLVEVGYGKMKPEEIKDILESRDRKRAGLTAPPQGLYLVEVLY